MNSTQLEAACLPFVAHSPDYALKKSKLLRQHFPQLNPGRAREATARALGYADWHALEVHARIPSQPSPSNDEVPFEVATARNAVQLAALTTFLDLKPAEAEAFLLRWNLTGSLRNDPRLEGIAAPDFHALLEHARQCARTPGALDLSSIPGKQHYERYRAFSEVEPRLDRALEHWLWEDPEVRRALFTWMSYQLGSVPQSTEGLNTQTWALVFELQLPIGHVQTCELPAKVAYDIRNFLETGLPHTVEVKVSQRVICSILEEGIPLSVAQIASALRDYEGQTPVERPEKSRTFETGLTSNLFVGLEFSSSEPYETLARATRTLQHMLERAPEKLAALKLTLPFLSYQSAPAVALLTPEQALAWAESIKEEFEEARELVNTVSTSSNPCIEVTRTHRLKNERGTLHTGISLGTPEQVSFQGQATAYRLALFLAREADRTGIQLQIANEVKGDRLSINFTKPLMTRLPARLAYLIEEVTERQFFIRDWGVATSQPPQTWHNAFHERLATDPGLAEVYVLFLDAMLSQTGPTFEWVGGARNVLCFIHYGTVHTHAAVRKLPESYLSDVERYLRAALGISTTPEVPLQVSPLVVCGREESPEPYLDLAALAAKRGLDAEVFSGDIRHYPVSQVEDMTSAYTVFFVHTDIERLQVDSVRNPLFSYPQISPRFPRPPWVDDSRAVDMPLWEVSDWLFDECLHPDSRDDCQALLEREEMDSAIFGALDTPPDMPGYRAVNLTAKYGVSEESLELYSTLIGLTVAGLALHTQATANE